MAMDLDDLAESYGATERRQLRRKQHEAERERWHTSLGIETPKEGDLEEGLSEADIQSEQGAPLSRAGTPIREDERAGVSK
jgi:hypothetical protein